ncbi:MAG: hypothetical protein K2F95_08320 [Alistipes sp.]|nr:hypothetical protein [Alistipes sp.]
MKHIKIWSLMAMMVVAMTSCGGSNENGGNEDTGLGEALTVNTLAGEWHLTSWGANDEIGDVYISFAADGTFDLYQLVYHAGYDHYTGRYSLERDGRLLTGVYSDNVPWATSYACGINAAGTTLNMLSQNNESVLSVYTKTSIPDDVKNGVITKAAAGEDEVRWL